jgi:hypothetical protein
MIHVIYTPKWFYGKDIFIDIFSILVLSLIGFFSLKYHRLNKNNKNYLWLALSFFILAASFLFKIMTNFTIYYNLVDTEKLGTFTLTYNQLQVSNILFSSGFFLYMALSLIGLFLLYYLYQKKVSKQTIFLIVYLIIMASYFSSLKYFVFHITSLVLLSLITLNYFKNYAKNKHRTSAFLACSFTVITLSQLVFIFIDLDMIYYAIAEIIQLTGYLLLLFTFVQAVKNAKTKQD